MATTKSTASKTKEYWRTYQREYARKRYSNPDHRQTRAEVRAKRRTERREQIDAMKLEMGCAGCGWKESAVALDFDHTHSKSMNVSRALSTIRGMDFIRTEMAKCVLLCACCHRVQTQERRKTRPVHTAYSRCIARRKATFDAIKLSRGCADCGYNEHAVALDFDHVRGEKSFNISASLYKAIPVLMAEVAKCDVYCARCHHIRTHETKVSGHRKNAAS